MPSAIRYFACEAGDAEAEEEADAEAEADGEPEGEASPGLLSWADDEAEAAGDGEPAPVDFCGPQAVAVAARATAAATPSVRIAAL
ncbi:hypothetical protein [Streptomyces sp. NBC_00536]|uniref:hypothetical protein n=1 Tax=Streptomyces sp. NBC_00536 TaxID=2975769 RepID=UPI003FCE4BB2